MSVFRMAICTAVIILLAITATAEDKYKKFDRQSAYSDYIRITYDGKRNTLETFDGGDVYSLTFRPSEARLSDGVVRINSATVMDGDGFVQEDLFYPIANIEKTRLEFHDKETVVSFLRRNSEAAPKYRSRKKNSISTYENIHIETVDFVRGSVISFWSDINIDGEVNEDVVAVYGNITIGKQAVVRGDVVAFSGNIDIDKGATIYGRVQSCGGKKESRFDKWRRWKKRDKDFSTIIRFYYDRVDGATPLLGVQFIDDDSLLPAAEIYLGYGFSSEQWRYHVGVEQSFWLEHPITLGGSIYRRLRTQDDWLMQQNDNTLFALLATEDYRDYYEAEGGYLFARFTPYPSLDFELGTLLENYKWLDAHTDLWSMFGGNKEFRSNFQSVPEVLRNDEIAQLDDANLASLNFHIGFDNSDEEERFGGSFWLGKAKLEWLPDGWNDDFDFTRYFLRAARYQIINDNSGMFFKAGYGGSDGDLPIHRRFFLGGLETLLGYKHKEYTGREFWFGNAEYRLTFPKTDISGLVSYNLGAISEESGELGEAEIKQSIGIGASFEESLRIDLARRLDKSDSSFEIYVRLGFNF